MLHLKALLEEVELGNTIDPGLLYSAKRDLKNLEDQISSGASQVTVVQSPVKTDTDLGIEVLGDLFMVLQSLIIEQRQKGNLNLMHADVADKIMNARVYLTDHHYEPATLGRLDAVKLRPVTYKKPDIDPEPYDGPQY